MHLPFQLQLWHGLTLLHLAAVATGLLLYVVLTHSGKQHRPPSAAIAWIVSLLAFPYLALPVYLLLGTRKLAHAAAVPAGLPQDGPPLTRGLDIPPPRHCRQVVLDADGPAALEALLLLLDGATRQIDIEMFIFRADAVGQRVAAALRRAVQRGVAVRVLVDGLGDFAWRRQTRRLLREAGVQLRWFSPVRLRLRPQFGRGNLRNHRKLVIVDARTAWSGGRNLADEYFLDGPQGPAWQDLSFSFDGELVEEACRCFAADWALAGGAGLLPANPGASSTPGTLQAQLLPSGPDRREDTAHDLYLTACYRSDARIWLATPYFVPDDALQAALGQAARRGVEVRLLLPARSNHRLADIARERSLRELSAAGVHVHLLGRMLHAKLALFDASLASCGSLNLDGRSLFLNYELNTLFFDEDTIAGFSSWFERSWAQSFPYAARAPGWWRDTVEGLVRAVGFQL
ncbi:MAG TPA: phospholipase D-like domain-containing protein [Candidatus Desulfobacillus sp.]|nr:phospholipase D-like domain-containing protein [Candidatus Desulfobacillus sp.]